MKRFKETNTFYCFSPPVMLFTFLFEIGAALYVVWRYQMNTIVRLITVMLIALAVFQFSEYMLCGGLGLQSYEWARLGYVSITLLPAIGIHLIATVAGKNAKGLIIGAYTSAILFALYFALTPGAINAHECRPNYAVFDLSPVSLMLYSLYYYGWLITGAALSFIWSKTAGNMKKPLLSLTAGYLVFMVPTATIGAIHPETTAGIPSIMCGFAIFFAIILTFYVIPKVATRRGKTKKKSKQ